jgi:RimJ/RimL family protein N-acetyltransferase
MSRANTAAAKAKRRRQHSAVRLTAYRPEDEELARAWLEADREAGVEGWDEWITDNWDHHWVVMRGDVPVGLAQAAILRGPVTLHDGTHPAEPVCEIGYFTAPDYRGQRIATEVVALLPRRKSSEIL